MITVVTPSDAAAAVPVATLREHLRISHIDEDTTLAMYGAAAVRALERLTGRSFGVTTYRAALVMPANQTLLVQLPDVATVAALKVTSPEGAETVIAANQRVLKTHAYGCMVLPATGVSWADYAGFDVTLDLTAGLSPIPSDITAALLLTASRFFADREDAMIPNAALNLCGPWRTGGWV